MQQLSRAFMNDLLRQHRSPCVSIYQPTHRFSPDNLQDPVRFKNLVATAEQALLSRYAEEVHKPLLAHLRERLGDPWFWSYQSEGMACFVSPDFSAYVNLQHPVREFVVVSDTFHIKPLLRIMQSADRYQVLCLSQNQVALYEGSRYGLEEIPLNPAVPRNLTEALGTEVTAPSVTGHKAAGGTNVILHSQSDRSDEAEKDLVRYFRHVDRTVQKYHSETSGLPLILVALAEHVPLFRSVSRNQHLMDFSIHRHPEAVDPDKLRLETWKLFEPHYEKKISAAVERFHVARSRQIASANLSEVAHASVFGRVDSLLVEGERHIPGKLDGLKGQIEMTVTPDAEDILDDIAEQVLLKGGQVFVIPSEMMPSGTGVAATYRY